MQSMLLSLYLEVEADAVDPEAVRKIIRHIDSQISGLPQSLRVGDRLVSYQVVHSHGQKDA